MSVFQQHFSRIRVPQGGDKVYKDECAFSFDNPVSLTDLDSFSPGRKCAPLAQGHGLE